MSDCTVYIDESGDLGVNKGTRWFILSAVIVKRADESSIRQRIQRIKTRLNIREIHISKISQFYKRAFIVRELAEEPFIYMNVIVDTSKFDNSKIPNTNLAYNYICSYLLQRVSWYLRDNGMIADIVLSARGTSKDAELIKYIQNKLLSSSQPIIDANLFGSVTAKAASSWELLQLADVCATSTYLGYEINKLGFCVPCFTAILSNHLYRYNSILDGYGLKFFSKNMKPDNDYVRRNMICAKEERTPGATTT